MSNLEFFKGSSENLSSVPIKEGRFIVTTDRNNKAIYLDIDDTTRAQITSSFIEEDEEIIIGGGGAPLPVEEND